MRILYIHQFFATRESELGLIRSYEFSRRWVEQGHEVTVITSSSRLPTEFSEKRIVDGEIDGIRVRSIRVPYSNYMGRARRIWSFIAFMTGASWLAVSAGRHDVILATSTPLTVGIPGFVASVLRAEPMVFEVRDLWPEAAIQMGVIRRRGLIGITAKALERFLYRRSRDVIALSPGMAAGVVSQGVPSEHVHMVPNSSDLDLFTPGCRDTALEAEFDLSDKFVVGYAGAIGPSNDVEGNVPQAARTLLDRGRTDIVFLIAGVGKSLPALEEAVKDLPNVRLAGCVAKAEVPRYTRTADTLMVLFADKPILATNSPNKFFDGLASGKPMIVNSDGWTRELVEANGAGRYFPATDGVALADIVEELADNPVARAQMGANALELAKSRFARDILAEEVLQVLRAAAVKGAPEPDSPESTAPQAERTITPDEPTDSPRSESQTPPSDEPGSEDAIP